MKTYAKGARFERELLQFLNYKKFAVLRVPSSGNKVSPVDIVAIKKGLVVAIECKAWDRLPKPPKDQLNRMKEWSDRAGAIGFVAWKKPGNTWLFLPVENALNNMYEEENWIEMENLLNALEIR